MAAGFASPAEAVSPRSVSPQPGARRGRQLWWRLLTLSLGLFILMGMGQPGPVGAAASAAPDSGAVPQGPLGFDACARLAIKQSPYFTNSAVEIDIRKMGESDSRFSMVPAVNFRSYYYVNQPEQYYGTTPKPYTLSFVTEAFNPFGAYFTLQAQKIATKITIFAHLQLISEGLVRLGQMFLNLAAMKQQSVSQADLVALGRENLNYAKKRQSIGTGTTLEMQVAFQELELAQSERARLEDSQKDTLDSLKTFLGLKSDSPVQFDLRDAPSQVLGSFKPANATLAQAKNRSFELKALELKKEVQKFNILVAKARVFPSFIFNAQTPDPLSASSARGIYVGFGLEVPIWDGFKRVRNISRQRAILKQYGNDKDLGEIKLTDKWTSLKEDLKSATAALKIARSQEELVRLKERQGEIRYHSGSEPLPVWLETRKGKIEAQKAITSNTLKYNSLVLNLRQLSGDLGYSYVDPKSWQN